MRTKKHLLPIVIILVLMMLQIVASAAEITLDGDFSDWDNKPSMTAPPEVSGNNAVYLIKWFPDTSTGTLYFLAERPPVDQKRYKFSDWNFTVFLKGDMGSRKLYVHYHPSSKFVDLDLYDQQNNWVWGVKGKWGDWHDDGNTIEFYLPMNMVVGDTRVGYDFSVYFESTDNRLPASGTILVSTISTFPLLPAIAGFLIAGMAAGVYLRKKTLKKAVNAQPKE